MPRRGRPASGPVWGPPLAAVSFLGVKGGLTVLPPGHWGHAGPGAGLVPSRAVRTRQACCPAARLATGGCPSCLRSPRSGGHAIPPGSGRGACAGTATCTGLLLGRRGRPAPSGVCARAHPCFPWTLPGSSLCVPAHAWSRSPGPLSVHPSTLMCPLHSVPRLHVEDFSLDSSLSQ